MFMVDMLAATVPGGICSIQVPLLTDNQGNAFSVLKQYSKAMPSAAVHMELSRHCRRVGTFVDVTHVKRHPNEWADELSELKTEAWSPSLRFHPDLSPNNLAVLDKILTARPRQSGIQFQKPLLSE